MKLSTTTKSIYSALIIIALAACNQNASKSAENQDLNDDTNMHNHESAPINTSVEIRADQSIYFPNLTEGQEISLPFVVEFGVKGMEVEPAGPINVDKGHHHLFVDQQPTPAGQMVPMGAEANGYFHFGKGQLKDTLTIAKYTKLTPGEHTLTLQFGNGAHLSYGPAMSKTIKIKVK